MQKAKQCATTKEADRYRLTLYSRWERVELVKAPIFQEEGLYVWAVYEVNQ